MIFQATSVISADKILGPPATPPAPDQHRSIESRDNDSLTGRSFQRHIPVSNGWTKKMAQPYVGEIRVFGGDFAPAGWALCNGQSIQISQNNVLFSLMGTTYGGDGQNTFNLPNLQGRSLIHQGTAASNTTYVEGQTGGVSTVTLSQPQTPLHTHVLSGSNIAGTVAVPGTTVTMASTPTGESIYDTVGANQVNLADAAIGMSTGQSLPHDNSQPYLGVTYIISLFGTYPSRN